MLIIYLYVYVFIYALTEIEIQLAEVGVKHGLMAQIISVNENVSACQR